MPPRKPQGSGKPSRKSNDQLTAMKCSTVLHGLVKELESDAMAVEQATYYTQRDTAYARLAVTREKLYRYVSALERHADIEQTITLRF